MTKQDKILIAYFIFGLPGLPVACFGWLNNKYIMGNRYPYDKIMFCSMMLSSTLVAILFYSIFKFFS